MKQLKVSKRRLTIIVAVVAVLGLTFSLLAETAGGVATLRDKNTASHSSVAYNPPTNPAGGVGLDTMGLGATLAAANYSTTSTTTNDLSSGSTSDTQSPSEPVSSSPTPQPSTPPTTTPQPPHHDCECPEHLSGHLETLCEHYCNPEPTPTPGCQPCGGFRETEHSGAIMCPMVMCAQ